MTYTFEKTFGKFDSSTNFEGNKLIVEYVFSSVSDSIKVVEMWRVGEDEFGEVGTHFHRMNWMSKEGQASLMEDYVEQRFKCEDCGKAPEKQVRWKPIKEQVRFRGLSPTEDRMDNGL